MNVLYTRMMEQADPSQVAGLARFFKTGPGQYGEGDKFLGIKVPVTRDVVKECWRSTGFPELEECISSEYHELRLAALLTLVEIFKHAGRRCPVKPGMTSGNNVIAGLTGNLRQDCIDFYLAHTAYINNWDLVDLSCYPLLGEWLLDKDRTLLYELARNGKTLWEQRIGMVSTMTFIRHGQLQDTFRIADILLHHEHDLIHKAVGWLLREAGKRDKAALEAYLQGASAEAHGFGEIIFPDGTGKTNFPEAIANPAHIGTKPAHEEIPRYKTMPRTMLRYAIEKFPEEERQQYLAKESAK